MEEGKQKEKKLKRDHISLPPPTSSILTSEEIQRILFAVEQGDRTAVRRVKNSAIGSQVTKRKWLQGGAATSIVNTLLRATEAVLADPHNPSHWDLLVDVAVTLGTLGRGEGGAGLVVRAGGGKGLAQLLQGKFIENSRVTVAALRSLRALALASQEPEKGLLAEAVAPVLPTLLQWLRPPTAVAVTPTVRGILTTELLAGTSFFSFVLTSDCYS